MEQVPGQALAPCADALTRGLLDSRVNEIVRGAYTCVWARVVLQSSLASADGTCQHQHLRLVKAYLINEMFV